MKFILILGISIILLAIAWFFYRFLAAKDRKTKKLYLYYLIFFILAESALVAAFLNHRGLNKILFIATILYGWRYLKVRNFKKDKQ